MKRTERQRAPLLPYSFETQRAEWEAEEQQDRDEPTSILSSVLAKAEELTRRAIAVFDAAMQRVKKAHEELEAPALAILQTLEDLNYSDVSRALRVKYFPIAKKTVVKPLKRGA